MILRQHGKFDDKAPLAGFEVPLSVLIMSILYAVEQQ
jgi:hypothetical protein